MSRKAPTEVRRERTRVQSSWPRTLPRALAAELRRTGRADLSPERIAVALAGWKWMSRQSRRDLDDASNDYVEYSGPTARDVLDVAIRALPKRFARELRKLVSPLDEAVAAKTLPDPFADPARPWWHRRLTDLYQA